MAAASVSTTQHRALANLEDPRTTQPEPVDNRTLWSEVTPKRPAKRTPQGPPKASQGSHATSMSFYADSLNPGVTGLYKQHEKTLKSLSIKGSGKPVDVR